MSNRVFSRILVTGGAGFIGAHFIRFALSRLSANGQVVNLDALTYAGNTENLADIAADPRYFFIQGNICDQPLVEELLKKHNIEAIIHFAAESHVDRSIEGPLHFIETNIRGTFHLLEAAKKHKVHFHHVSTDEVYGALGHEGKFTEDSPYRPNSPYSASKAASDHLVRAYHQTYGIAMTLSNCSNNFGPGQFEEKLIPKTITNFLSQTEVPVYGQGQQVRDWLYVEDHVKALWMIVHQGALGETYNIGGGHEWKNIELVQEIAKIVSEMKDISLESLLALIRFVPDRLGHDFRYAIDPKKMEQTFNWRPSAHFNEHLKHTVAWYAQKSIRSEATSSAAP